MRTPPSSPEMYLLHEIKLGLLSKLLKIWHDITLMDAPVSYKASTAMLFILTLYRMALPKLPHLL